MYNTPATKMLLICIFIYIGKHFVMILMLNNQQVLAHHSLASKTLNCFRMCVSHLSEETIKSEACTLYTVSIQRQLLAVLGNQGA
jgi:hypothetical protein